MEYSLQAIYYLIRGFINLLLQMEVSEGVTVGGVIFAVMLLSGIFVALGLMAPTIRSGDRIDDQPALPDYGGYTSETRGDNFTMR